MSNILTCAISKTSLQRKRYLRGREGRGEMEERRERGREGGREGGRERGRKVGERDEPWLANKMYQHAYLSEESLKS